MNLQDELLRMNKEAPYIGILGATQPEKYSRKQGIAVGSALRAYLEEAKGTLFTGGVDGVGVDVYTGISQFCVDAAVRTGTMPSDRFFVLIPNYYSKSRKGNVFGCSESDSPVPFRVPVAYDALSFLIKRRSVDNVFAGDDLEERRRLVGEVGNVFIVVNGSFGTLDEVQHALRLSKPVITLASTGNAASYLAEIRSGQRNSEAFASEGINFKGLDLEKISVAKNTEEMIEHLKMISLDAISH